MSSHKQLLVSCITLLCLEHREDSPASASTELISDVLDTISVKETSIDTDHGRQILLELRRMVVELNCKTPNEFPSTMEVLQNVQVTAREESYLYEAVATAVNEVFPNGLALMQRINEKRNGMRAHLNDTKIQSIMKEYSHKLLFQAVGSTNSINLIREMNAKLDPYVQARQDARHPAEIGTVDFDDPELVQKYFEAVKETMSVEGAFKTGWKGFNRMLGKLGAIRRGEFILGGGLQHNFKTGLALTLFSHICLFNKPFMRDKNKKPMALFVTLENELSDNLLILYKYLMENETGEAVDETQIDPVAATQYIAARLQETGFKVLITRFDPTDFTIAGFTNWLDGIQAQGYEIQYLCVDYLNMLPKTGLDAKVAGDDIRLLFRRMRNYTTPRGITFFSPHQLSSDALQLMRENTEDFVKVVANRGYYDGCRRLGQEPDLELIFHIVKIAGKSYFTIQRGKHRNTVTAEADQYCVLPFAPVGTLPWDIDKEADFSLRNLPGMSGEAGDEAWSI
uniref:DNA helicase n=1 Tax=Pseudomonas phage RVTF4 TaxID=3236931 RepID=A0AB39CD18_9VIRU